MLVYILINNVAKKDTIPWEGKAIVDGFLKGSNDNKSVYWMQYFVYEKRSNHQSEDAGDCKRFDWLK